MLWRRYFQQEFLFRELASGAAGRPLSQRGDRRGSYPARVALH